MIKLIVGKKGTGKTKTLLEQVNAAAKNTKGYVVCIEKGDALRFDLSYHIRLIDIDEYHVRGTDAYYGFIVGLLAGNYDITDIFGDATFKILFGKDAKDYEAFAAFIQRLDKLLGTREMVMTFTVSCEADDLPDSVRKYIV